MSMAAGMFDASGSERSIKTLTRPGTIVEVVGRLSSGRTSVLVAWIADVTRAGGMVALVDADDTFDPASAARAGVDLARVRWVRCAGCRAAAIRAIELLVRCPGFALIALDTGQSSLGLPPTRAFRLKLAARRADVPVVIVGERRIAGAAADVAVEVVAEQLEWTRAGARATRLAGLCTTLHLVRPQAAAHPRALPLRWPRALRLTA